MHGAGVDHAFGLIEDSSLFFSGGSLAVRAMMIMVMMVTSRCFLICHRMCLREGPSLIRET
ncbi:hypothetical protein CDO31_35860 (plasmid) [Sinorhizobium meliloti]|nr:hypothetical protein CDO31_35860 [Sinorhizobium meliloti]